MTNQKISEPTEVQKTLQAEYAKHEVKADADKVAYLSRRLGLLGELARTGPEADAQHDEVVRDDVIALEAMVAYLTPTERTPTMVRTAADRETLISTRLAAT